MNVLLSFSTARFDAVNEPLTWLLERLTTLGLVADGAVEAKKRGWLVDVDVFGEPYQLVCSTDKGARDTSKGAEHSLVQDWALRITARRSIIDRLLGRRELTADNALVRIVLEILERQPDFTAVDMVVE